MAYTVTITPSHGQETTYLCGGVTDEEALIYAGKIVEANADRSDPAAKVTIFKDENSIGPATTVKDMMRTTV